MYVVGGCIDVCIKSAYVSGENNYEEYMPKLEELFKSRIYTSKERRIYDTSNDRGESMTLAMTEENL